MNQKKIKLIRKGLRLRLAEQQPESSKLSKKLQATLMKYEAKLAKKNYKNLDKNERSLLRR